MCTIYKCTCFYANVIDIHNIAGKIRTGQYTSELAPHHQRAPTRKISAIAPTGDNARTVWEKRRYGGILWQRWSGRGKGHPLPAMYGRETCLAPGTSRSCFTCFEGGLSLPHCRGIALLGALNDLISLLDGDRPNPIHRAIKRRLPGVCYPRCS